MDRLLLHFDWPTEGLILRLRFRSDTIIEVLPFNEIGITHLWGGGRIEGVSPVVINILKEMTMRWVEKSELWSLTVEGQGARKTEDKIANFSELVWLLVRLEFLCQLQLLADNKPIITVEPLSPDSALVFANDPIDTLRLSRFAFLQRHEYGLAMESAVGVHRIILHDDWAASLLTHFARGESMTCINNDQLTHIPQAARTLVELLDAAGMLEDREHSLAIGIGDHLTKFGEFHDLLFHRRSRFGQHDQPFGAAFPFLDHTPPLPAIPTPLSAAVISLPIPSESEVRARDLTLTQVLERRVSVRQYGNDPITLTQLAEFLFRCARTRACYGPTPELGMPYEAIDRPYPTGGGVSDLELYIVANLVHGLPRGIYHYAADRHLLEQLESKEENIEDLLQTAMKASGAIEPPQVLIAITSRFGRMSWKYCSISYATTLKNVGVLYQTMYLVATAMGLGACALGSGNNIVANKALGLVSRSEIPVGEFMIGAQGHGTNAPLDTRSRLKTHNTWCPLVGSDWGQS